MINDDNLDIINDDEEILSHASKVEIHQKHLLHKSIHVLIIDSLGRIYCRNRKRQQSATFGWTSSVGAHVLSGQNFDQTARQALQNMLGINCPLTLIDKARINCKTENELVAVYTGYANEVKLNPDLGQTGQFFTIEDLKHLIATQTVTPHLVEALNLYMKNN